MDRPILIVEGRSGEAELNHNELKAFTGVWHRSYSNTHMLLAKASYMSVANINGIGSFSWETLGVGYI